MHYIEVLVADTTYHGTEGLTYSSELPLEAGTIVHVPIRQRQVLGVVCATVAKPRFTVKPIVSAAVLPVLPAPLLSLVSWMKEYYPAPLGILTHLVLPKSLPDKPTALESLPAIDTPKLPDLTPDQQQALVQMRGPGLHLLHGETGTGKTRVYMQLAKEAMARHESSIILSPEIGLTSQLAQNFRKIFGKRVIILHSKLSDATRKRIWQYLLELQEPVIVIGARSALFSPLNKVGLIVVDEAHETAYKQDQAPYYHTTTVAAKLSALYNATLILGSATPLVNDYYVASKKSRPIIRMTTIAATASAHERQIDIVDLKDRQAFTKSPYLSNKLITALQDSLQQDTQSLLFLNRRGTARVIFCEKCGWQAACSHCDLPLVYHGDTHSMRCHSCGFKGESPSSCPECHNTAIVFKSIGTKAVAEEVKRLFPEARIMRFDTDNKKNERIEEHYDSVRIGDVDVLIGTQTLAKGLDLPKLSLVGVIIADTSLYFPDFSAQERTYQLLIQVLGRVGRGHRKSQVVVQTYMPDSPLIQSVTSKDWDNFYNNELSERSQFLFPPFCYLLKLTCKRASSTSAGRTAQLLADELRRTVSGILVEGPAPSFHEKIQNKFAWQLVIKSKRRHTLVDIIKSLPSGWSYDIDPMNLL
jgi:primosomal protein N' (replication factor Y)